MANEARLAAIPIIVEQHPDTYVAYALGAEGAEVGEGDTFEEALADCRSALRFHMETFGEDVLDVDMPVLEATLVQSSIA